MIDKELFRLVGGNKKYIFLAVALQTVGLLANVSITACLCWAIWLAIQKAEWLAFVYPAVCAVVGSAVRYTMTRLTGDIKDKLGRSVKKDLFDETIEDNLRIANPNAAEKNWKRLVKWRLCTIIGI